MSELNPKGNALTIGKRTYNLVFSVNIIDDIQDRFDKPISELPTLLQDERMRFKVTKYLVCALVNEAVDIHNDTSDEKWEKVDERYIGRNMTTQNIATYTTVIMKTFADSAPKVDDDPNAARAVEEKSTLPE